MLTLIYVGYLAFKASLLDRGSSLMQNITPEFFSVTMHQLPPFSTCVLLSELTRFDVGISISEVNKPIEPVDRYAWVIGMYCL